MISKGLITFNGKQLYVLFELLFDRINGVYDNQGWWIAELKVYYPIENGFIRIFDDEMVEQVHQYINDGDYNEELIEPYLSEKGELTNE